MLNPKKTIPQLAVAALALTGCGDSGGGGGGSGESGGVGGEPELSSFEAWCMHLQDCSAEEMPPTPTPRVCDEDASELPAGCEDALESYFDCRSALSCDADLYACQDEADVEDILDCL